MYKYEANTAEREIERYIHENGIKVISCKQYVSKTKLVLEHEGVITELEVTSNYKKGAIVKVFERLHELNKQIAKVV